MTRAGPGGEGLLAPDIEDLFVDDRSTYRLGVEGLFEVLDEEFTDVFEELVDTADFVEGPRPLDDIRQRPRREAAPTGQPLTCHRIHQLRGELFSCRRGAVNAARLRLSGATVVSQARASVLDGRW